MELSTGDSVTAVDEDELCQTLPDELMEMIIAKMPFPSIFKARCLSKSWRARFCPISSRDDGANQSLAASFQKQVRERSSNWESFGPVVAYRDDYGAYMAYNGPSNSWRRLPSLLSFFDDNLLPRFPDQNTKVQIEGALLCIYKYQVYVANILTQRWKRLPPRPNTDVLILCRTLVTDASSQTYKVVLICQLNKWDKVADPFSAEIYDSKSDSWSCKKLVNSMHFRDLRSLVPNSVHLNGVLYLLVDHKPAVLWAVSVEEDTFNELPLDFDDVLEATYRCRYLLVCNADLLLIVCTRLHCQVLKVDLGSLRLLLVSESPPVGALLFLPDPPVSDGSYIVLGRESRGMLRYHLDEDEWSFVPVPTIYASAMYSWIGYSFRPGLCPFAAV